MLLRTLKVWEYLGSISIPRQIRELLESTYVERDEGYLFSKLKQELETERDKLQRFALLSISRGGVTLPETKAATRYAEQETCDVLLLRSIEKTRDGMQIRLLDDSILRLPKDLKRKDRNLWYSIAAEITNNIVIVPEKQAPIHRKKSEIAWLADYVYLGGEDNPFRIALVNDDNEIISLDMRKALPGYELYYTSLSGYQVKKIGVDQDSEEGW